MLGLGEQTGKEVSLCLQLNNVHTKVEKKNVLEM